MTICYCFKITQQLVYLIICVTIITGNLDIHVSGRHLNNLEAWPNLWTANHKQRLLSTPYGFSCITDITSKYFVCTFFLGLKPAS